MQIRTPWLVLLLLAAPPAHPQNLIATYTVSAGGKPVTLYEFPKGSFGQIEVARPVDVEIKTNFDVRWVDVRPRSAGIDPVIAADHASLKFQLAKPVPLTIEFNGDWKRVLHLFANPPEKDPPSPDTPGVRYFGPGTHEAGAIELKDGETLYLAPGAWVKGNVSSSGTRNVTIRGRGVLDSSIFQRPAAPVGAPSAATPAAAPVPARLPSGQPFHRNMIYFEDTQGFRIEGITLVNSPTWTVYARRTEGTRIDGIRILNGGGACSTDGIDVVSSSDVLIENVFIRTNDDNVVVKNSDSRDVHDITVRHAVFWNEPCGNAIDVGFELRSGSIRKLRFEDIDVIRVERGAVLAIHNGDSATVEDVVFDNIRVEDARHKLIDFAIVWGRYGVDRPERNIPSDPGGAWDGVLALTPEDRVAHSRNRGQVRNVRVTNLQIVEGSLPFSVLSGFDKEHPVENVTVEGMTWLGRPLRTAKDARFSLDNAPGFKIR